MNSLEKQTRLDRAARDIRSRFDCAQLMDKRSNAFRNEALTEAILCGQVLAEAKATVGRRNWLRWLSEHFPDVRPATAARYMRLARNAEKMA